MNGTKGKEMVERVESSAAGGNSKLKEQHTCAGGDNSSNEEELSVLPRHTKVVVTGNNRTKSVLIGLQGVVKKAVGLGGWHWLVLANGLEVKLQRNALSVVEPATGHEDDDDLGRESNESESDDKSYRRKRRTSVRCAQKTMAETLSCDSRTRESFSPLARGSTKVKLRKLERASLLRYLRHYNLMNGMRNATKEQLVDIVQRHFMSQQMDETQVIVGFAQAAKRLKARTLRN